MAGRIAYLGNIVTQGLVLDLDAAIQGSYPKTGTLWTDISGNNNNGTLTNGPAYTGSDYGAIVFDGTDDFVDCGTANIIPNSWTLTSWIKHSYRVGYGNIIARSATAPLFEQNATLGWATTRSSSFSVGGRLTNGTFYYECTSSVFLNTGSILNIVGTFNEPITTLTLYINGAPVNTKNAGFPMTITGSQRIQVGCSDGNTPANFFSGSIYQTQIYNQALSQFQVWQNFNAYKSRYGIPDIVTDGLVLNLDAGNPYSYLSGSSGTTWTDTSGVGNNGTLTNGPVYSNGAIVFDGVDDYVNVPYTASKISFPDNNATICVWFNSSPSGDNYGCLVTQRSANSTGFQTYVYQNKFFADGGGVLAGVFSTTTIVKGTTYFGCVVYDKTNSLLKLYVNGNFESQTSYTGNIQDTYPIRLGNGAFSDGPYPGSIYASQIYNRVLTQDEITQNFNALRGRYGI